MAVADGKSQLGPQSGFGVAAERALQPRLRCRIDQSLSLSGPRRVSIPQIVVASLRPGTGRHGTVRLNLAPQILSGHTESGQKLVLGRV